jgi:hypothetical protein
MTYKGKDIYASLKHALLSSVNNRLAAAVNEHSEKIKSE